MGLRKATGVLRSDPSVRVHLEWDPSRTHLKLTLHFPTTSQTIQGDPASTFLFHSRKGELEIIPVTHPSLACVFPDPMGLLAETFRPWGVHPTRKRSPWLLWGTLLSAGILLGVFYLAGKGIHYVAGGGLARDLAFLIPDSLLMSLDTSLLNHPSETSWHPWKPSSSLLEECLLPVVNEASRQWNIPFHLHFIDEDFPNAFALPSGDLIFTDELIRIARDFTSDSCRALQGVLLHEMGHVIHRHAIQNIIQAHIFQVGLALLAGDISVITVLSADLLNLAYSRRMEREADYVAICWFFSHNYPLHPLKEMFQGLLEEASSPHITVPTWLSTHPALDERIRYIEKWERKPPSEEWCRQWLEVP